MFNFLFASSKHDLSDESIKHLLKITREFLNNTSTDPTLKLDLLKEIVNSLQSIQQIIERQASSVQCKTKIFGILEMDADLIEAEIASLKYSNHALQKTTIMEKMAQLGELFFRIIWKYRADLVVQCLSDNPLTLDGLLKRSVLKSVLSISFHVLLQATSQMMTRGSNKEEQILKTLQERARTIILDIVLFHESLEWISGTTTSNNLRMETKLEELTKKNTQGQRYSLDLMALCMHHWRQQCKSSCNVFISHRFLSLHMENIILLFSRVERKHFRDSVLFSISSLGSINLNKFQVVQDTNILFKWVCTCSLICCFKNNVSISMDFCNVLISKFTDTEPLQESSILLEYIVSRIEKLYEIIIPTQDYNNSKLTYIDNLLILQHYPFDLLITIEKGNSFEIILGIDLIVKTLLLNELNLKDNQWVSRAMQFITQFNLQEAVVEILTRCMIEIGHEIPPKTSLRSFRAYYSIILHCSEMEIDKFQVIVPKLLETIDTMIHEGKTINRTACDRLQNVSDFSLLVKSCLDMFCNCMNDIYPARSRILLSIMSYSLAQYMTPFQFQRDGSEIIYKQLLLLSQFGHVLFPPSIFLQHNTTYPSLMLLHRFFNFLILRQPFTREAMNVDFFRLCSEFGFQEMVDSFLKQLAFIDNIQNGRNFDWPMKKVNGWNEVLYANVIRKFKDQLVKAQALHLLVDVEILFTDSFVHEIE
ncbi:hypothetical protein C9374_005364 [Naegleria lovaniensis]|uniref:Uncharacterized protein n=1 Tax=Naegleria lovaniensis TaxID=51637 RepID=A0AA88GPT3_NAELO|nr:uncharacterized protein C9374_005364 [Naegleria lovaniensis]KAG2382162.1 hypothetical protein C9374_005364 [Naegleria lovaniensis]